MSNIVDVIVIAIDSPLQIGIYKENRLIETISQEGKTSDILPHLFRDILERYTIGKIVYTNGPGSFMAIKVGYIFLKTISIVKNIPLFGVDGFYFNSNQPIRATNSLYFVKRDNGDIEIERLENFTPAPFELPKHFEIDRYSKNIEPIYILPVI